MKVKDEKVKRVLEQCRRKIIKLTGKPVSLVMFGYREEEAMTIEDIINAVCCTMNEPYDRVVSKSRKRELVTARQLIFFYTRHCTKVSHRIISEQMGSRDHTTSIHGIKTVRELMHAKDVAILDAMKSINQLLNITT